MYSPITIWMARKQSLNLIKHPMILGNTDVQTCKDNKTSHWTVLSQLKPDSLIVSQFIILKTAYRNGDFGLQ